MNNLTIKVNTKEVACSGDHLNKLGHPKVYLTFNEGSNKIVCPYCSTVYIYEVSDQEKLCLN